MARYLWLLLFWGLLVGTAGGSVAMLGLARLLTRLRVPGAAAIGSVLASSFTGSVIGGGSTNVLVTGPSTIPVMRRAGYKTEEAGAIEAVASGASALIPPVLGYAAFLMAALIEVSYSKIVVMSLVPAFLWLMATIVYIASHALRNPGTILPLNSSELGGPERIGASRYIRSAVIFLAPITVVLVLAVQGWTLRTGAMWAFVALVVTSVGLRVETRWSVWTVGIRRAAFYASSLTLVFVLLSLVFGALECTHFSGTLAQLFEDVSGGYVLVGGIIMIIFGVILGAGLPAVAVYLIMTFSFTPALVSNFDVPVPVAHYVALARIHRWRV